MATTNIESNIQYITGVADADDQTVISAQKFVVSSMPRDLLQFAQGASASSTDGSAISYTANDSIIDVQRNGFSCREVPLNESQWVLDATSLKYATAKHPVYFHKQGAVHFAPVTNGSNAGYIFYIDYSKIDDSSDLRNIVINYASSREFSKLATISDISWDTVNSPPHVPSPSFTTPDIAAITAGSLGAVPTFSPPVMSNLDFTDSDNWINTEEDSEMLSSRIQDIQARIGEFTAKLQSEQAKFNKENAIYQATVQTALQDMQVAAQVAQQETNLLLQQEAQEYQQKLANFSAQLQDYQANVNEVITLNQSKMGLCQHYSTMADKYYNWALAEVKGFIENNNKTLAKAVALRGNQ